MLVCKKRARLQNKCSFAKKGVLVCKKKGARLQKHCARLQKSAARLQKVQVSVDNVDRAKVDPTNATLVVVELVETGTKQKEIKYRLACRMGKIKSLYERSYISPVFGSTPELHGLQVALDSWAGMPEVSLRQAMAVQSTVGGQGMVHCNCKGSCESNKCSCFKAGRKCNSRCHKGNTCCTNHDD